MSDGAQLRDEAIERVERAADQQWMELAKFIVRRLSVRQGRFTTDDVWQRIGSPREPRAMGAVMTWARRSGIAQPTESFTPSGRPEAHRRPIRIWRGTDAQ